MMMEATATPKKESYFYLSALTVLSALAVVMLHFNGIFWQHKQEIWLSSCLIEALFYFAVPVFFMISGCTLIDYKKRYSTPTFFVKRMHRTLIPFLLWSLISLVSMWNYDSTLDLHPWSVVCGIMKQEYMPIYWFFMPLFAIYLCMPVLADMEHKVKTFSYMALLGCITIGIFSMLRNNGLTAFNQALEAPLCGGFLVYPLLGYVLHHKELSKKARGWLYAGGVLCFAAHFISMYRFSPAQGSICGVFKNYLYITTIIQACAVFVFFRYHADTLARCKWIKRAVLFAQPATLGIYLSHMYVHYTLTATVCDATSVLYRTLGAVTVFILLTCGIRLLQKFRFLRYLFP